ncbi:MAG: response regulator [Bacteroidetes bacterium]|nr:response regulator [Bacteroidota bacterium]
MYSRPVLFLIILLTTAFSFAKATSAPELQSTSRHLDREILLQSLLDSARKARKFDVQFSLRLANQGIAKADSLAEPLWKARFYCNRGISLRMLNLYDEAVKSQYEALSVFQQFSDSTHIAKSMYELGQLYALTRDYDRALSYHFNALYLREYDTNLIARAKSYLAIGEVLTLINDSWRALDFLLNARLILEKRQETSLLATTMFRLAELMLRMQRYNEALDHIDKALALAADDARKSEFQLLKARILWQVNKTDQAVEILREVQPGLEARRNFAALIELHTLLKDIKKNQGNFEAALVHADLLNTFSDSLRSRQRIEEISRLQLKFETSQLEANNEILKLKLKEAKYENRRMALIIVILVMGMLIVIAIRVVMRNRRANRRLQEMNQLLEQKVEERTSELRQQSNNLQSANDALTKSETMLRAIIETVPLGVVVTSPDGKASLFNPQLKDLGFSAEELQKADWFKHIVPGEQQKIRELWFGAHTHHMPLPETTFRIILSKQLKWLRMRGKCLHLDGNFSGMVIIIEDFSEVKKYETDLIKAKNKAEESDKLKSAFLANMSHEIRTPMNAILGFADLLPSDDYEPEEKQEFINTIQSSGQLLLNLINDIIDISKIEAGELKIIPATFELGALMETLQQTFRKQLDLNGKNDVKLVLSNKEASENYTVHTDKLRLQQILTNLLSNAVKFTHQGNIEFGVIRVDDQYEFYVKDTGIGIPESKLDVIFDRFRQADDSHTKQYGGTGLGLAISRQLAQLLGGKMWVESVEGKGTTFYFTIPCQFTDKDALKDYPDYSDKKVLVVEDVEANFHLLNNMLKRSGITVLHASNGYTAIEIAREEQPDLVLMDIQLPELDGVGALRALRKEKYTKPIVAITAFALAGDAQYYLRQGFDSYLSKPLSLEKLYSLLQLFFDPETRLGQPVEFLHDDQGDAAQ